MRCKSMLSRDWFRLITISGFLLGALPPGAYTLHSQDRQPADLVDAGRVQALTLEELGWIEESREQQDGFLELRGSWLGPVYHGVNSSWDMVDRQMTEWARIWIPSSQAPGATVSQLVLANHVQAFMDEPRDACVELAGRFPLAIIRHAEKQEDWEWLGFRDRDRWINRQTGAMKHQNPCRAQDYRSSNLQYCLAETQLMALTLLSRLLETSGYTPGPAGMMGMCKEGQSTWIASALDDRLVAAAPGSSFYDVLQMVQTWVDNGRCSMTDSLLWLTTTEGGQGFLDYWSVERFAKHLKPEFFLLWGDVGLHEMHDGIFYEIEYDTYFLETFSAVPFRFDRQPDHYGRETRNQYRSRLMELLAHYLCTREVASFPKVHDSSADVEEGRFRARAHVTPEPPAVRLWWSHSDDRLFNDPENAPWVAVDMVPEGDLWISPWVATPPGEMIGWYVEAEAPLSWESLSIPRRDTSPQRFFHKFPPLSCAQAPLPDCPPETPAALAAVGGSWRVDLDWDDCVAFGLQGYHVYRSVTANQGYQRLTMLAPVEESHYTDLNVEDTTPYYYRIAAVDQWQRQSQPCLPQSARPIPTFLRADTNADGSVDTSDAIATFSFLFLGQGDITCQDAADANDDGAINLADGIYTLQHLFANGPAIPPPYTVCDIDPTPDGLDCAAYEPCRQ